VKKLIIELDGGNFYAVRYADIIKNLIYIGNFSGQLELLPAALGILRQ
jgi:hypothetical protein